MSDYANGADGSCQSCGADTDEEWHLLCRDCYADEQGWTRPASDPPPSQPEAELPPSVIVILARLRTELDDLVASVERLERRGAA